MRRVVAPYGVAGNVLDDAELLDLFRQIGRLRAQEREAIRVILRALVEQADARSHEHEPKKRAKKVG